MKRVALVATIFAAFVLGALSPSVRFAPAQVQGPHFVPLDAFERAAFDGAVERSQQRLAEEIRGLCEAYREKHPATPRGRLVYSIEEKQRGLVLVPPDVAPVQTS